jgi:hypothetical protein
MIAFTVDHNDEGYRLYRVEVVDGEIRSFEPVGSSNTYEVVIGLLNEQAYRTYHFGGSRWLPST